MFYGYTGNALNYLEETREVMGDAFIESTEFKKERARLDLAITPNQKTASKAFILINELLKTQDKDPEIWYLSGLVFEKASRISHAILDFKKALELKPDYPEALKKLQQLEQLLKQSS